MNACCVRYEKQNTPVTEQERGNWDEDELFIDSISHLVLSIEMYTQSVCIVLKVSEVEVEEDVMINHLQTIYINIISISNTVLVKLIDARQRWQWVSNYLSDAKCDPSHTVLIKTQKLAHLFDFFELHIVSFFCSYLSMHPQYSWLKEN